MLHLNNDHSSNESSTTVNRVQTACTQWQINRLLHSRDREPSRISGSGGECLFSKCMVILRFIGLLQL